MSRNNNLNHINPNSDDMNSLELANLYWNNFEKKEITPIKTTYVDYHDSKVWTKEEIDEVFNKLKEKWFLKNYKDIHPIETVRIALMNFGISSFGELVDNGNRERNQKSILDEKIEKEYNTVFHTMCILQSLDEYKELTPQIKNIEYEVPFFKICEIIRYYRNTLANIYYGMNASNPNHDSFNTPASYTILKNIYKQTDTDEKKDHQMLLENLLEVCANNKYSKYKDAVYKPVYTKEGHYTLSCIRVKEIKEFVYEQTSRDENPLLWDLATKDKSTYPFIISQLENCIDSSFPFLEKDRTLFSFNNGIYQILKEEQDADGNKYYVDKFYPYSEDERPGLKPGVVSSKYFDMEFEYEEKIDDWYDIETPEFQKVLDLQFTDDKEYEDICRWMYILIGRLLYPVGQLDDWQVIAFMKGLAGTGKGTSCKMVQRFFEPEDVGVLGNDSEKTFALSALYDKLLFVAPEIKGDISLPQALFQSIISGEDVSIARKHHTAISVTWEVPGILAGNEVPNWTDNSGSIARRLILFAFNKKVPKSKVDPLLWQKMQKNIPALLRKCNLAYLDAINKYASKNIWEILPRYFLLRQEELSEQTNELKKFLKGPNVVYSHNYYITEKELRTAFNAHIKENGLTYKYSMDKLNEPFQSLEEEYNTEIKIVKIDRRKTKIKNLDNDDFKDRKGYYIRGMTIQDPSTGEIPEDEDFVSFLKQVEKL